MFENASALPEAYFWMKGKSARECVEIRHDAAALEEPGFWVVVAPFIGEPTFARFTEISESEFISKGQWSAIDSKWKSSLSQSEYINYVEKIRDGIADGWVYQVNACRILSAPLEDAISLRPLMGELLKENPAPQSVYINLPDIEIASASPELFIRVVKSKSGARKILSSPIKGTSATSEFLEKDLAENVMIVDLIRNDLSVICETGSVEVPRLLGIEKHPGLYHLVSDVSGVLRNEIVWHEIFDAIMAPGSVSGAPKSSALEMIARLEEVSRGPYCGAIGWVCDGEAELSVAIRTFWSERDGLLRFGTGAGITWGSNAASEWEETELKASRLISIASGKLINVRAKA